MEAKWDAIATKIMILTIIVVGVVGRRIVWKQYVAVHQHHQPWRHSQQPDPPRPGIQPGIDIVWKNNCFVSFIRLNSHSSSIIVSVVVVVVIGFLQDIIKWIGNSMIEIAGLSHIICDNDVVNAKGNDSRTSNLDPPEQKLFIVHLNSIPI